MMAEEINELNNFYNKHLAVDSVQSIEETDVVAILLTKEDYANEEIPYFDLIKKLADKDKKISDFGNSTSIVLNSASGFRTIIIAGLGGADKLTPDILRKAAGETARAIVKAKGDKTLVYSSPVISNDDHFYLSALIEGLILGSYEFNE